MILATDRLLLREFVKDDWEPVLAYQSDARYLKYYPGPHRVAEEVRNLVRGFIKWQGERPRTKYQLAIVLRAEGRLIGNCGIRMETATLGKRISATRSRRDIGKKATRPKPCGP